VKERLQTSAAKQGPVEFANVALFEELSRVAETQLVNAITSAGYVYGQVCRVLCASFSPCA